MKIERGAARNLIPADVLCKILGQSTSDPCLLSARRTPRPDWYLDDVVAARILILNCTSGLLHTAGCMLERKGHSCLPNVWEFVWIFFIWGWGVGACLQWWVGGGGNAISAPLLTQSVSAQKISHQWPLGLPSPARSQSKDLTGIRIKPKLMGRSSGGGEEAPCSCRKHSALFNPRTWGRKCKNGTSCSFSIVCT